MTDAQIAALRAALLADTTPAVVAARAIRNDTELARLYNQPSAFVVWRTSVSTDDIFDGITWANFTPNTSVLDADLTSQAISLQRVAQALQCQGKQFNVQTMLVGRSTVDPSKARTRNGLQDALTGIPSGNNGNPRDAGWPNVLPLLKRFATVAERIFANGTGTDATPGNLGGVVGDINIEQVGRALNG